MAQETVNARREAARLRAENARLAHRVAELELRAGDVATYPATRAPA